VAETDFLCLLKNELDPGESEAIALAKEIKSDLILLDERDARQIARSPLLMFSVLLAYSFKLNVWAMSLKEMPLNGATNRSFFLKIERYVP